MIRSFVMLTDSQINPDAVKGTIVYKAAKADYGCASDDTAMTGIPHISVSLKPDGDYPFFTHPLRDLEERVDIDNPKTIRPYTQDPSEFVSLEDYKKAVAQLRSQFEWIDCTERMPDREVEVLVKYIPPGQTKPIVVAALQDRLFSDEERLIWWNSRGEAMSGKVTHWMVMPA